MNKLHVFAVCIVAMICAAKAEVVKFDPCFLPVPGDFSNFYFVSIDMKKKIED